jgi:hypothetical protein
VKLSRRGEEKKVTSTIAALDKRAWSSCERELETGLDWNDVVGVGAVRLVFPKLRLSLAEAVGALVSYYSNYESVQPEQYILDMILFCKSMLYGIFAVTAYSKRATVVVYTPKTICTRSRLSQIFHPCARQDNIENYNPLQNSPNIHYRTEYI